MKQEIKHHGILGMKWGVRRTPSQLGHRPGGGEPPSTKSSAKKQETRKERKERERKEAEKTKRLKAVIEARTKGQQEAAKPKVIKRDKSAESKKLVISEMSSAEIKSMIDRFRLEKELKTILAEQSSNPRMDKAKKMVGNVLWSVGETQLKNYLNRSITSAMNKSIEKKDT